MSAAPVIDVRDGSVRSRILIALSCLTASESMTVRQLAQALGLSENNLNRVYEQMKAHLAAGYVQRLKHHGPHGRGYLCSYRLTQGVVLLDIEAAVQRGAVITESTA